jgi:hypothetical protein
MVGGAGGNVGEPAVDFGNRARFACYLPDCLHIGLPMLIGRAVDREPTFLDHKNFNRWHLEASYA